MEGLGVGKGVGSQEVEPTALNIGSVDSVNIFDNVELTACMQEYGFVRPPAHVLATPDY